MDGTLFGIYIAETGSGPMVRLDSVRAIPGKGLEGDRYFLGTGTWVEHPGGDREVTLIEREAIEAIERESEISIDAGDSRRNLVTTGVALNHLVGREFRVGDVLLRGKRLCEPCNHLEALTKKGVRQSLVHRGGLRAEILSEGEIRAGDQIQLTG